MVAARRQLLLLTFLTAFSAAVRTGELADERGPSNEEVKTCSPAGWIKFVAKFGVRATGALHFSRKPQNSSKYDLFYNKPCDKNNILMFVTVHDAHGAFNYDEFFCYRVMKWATRGCSVTVRHVNSSEMAIGVLNDFADKSVMHLAFGGHGYGAGLCWQQGECMDVNSFTARQLVLQAATKMQRAGSIFFDSCLAATLHVEECIAAFTSRLVGKDVTVTGPVHSFWSGELAQDVDAKTTEFRNAVAAGFRIFQSSETDVYRQAKKGDWIRAWCCSPDPMNASKGRTYPGIVLDDQPRIGKDGMAYILVFMQDEKQWIPTVLISRLVSPGPNVTMSWPEKDLFNRWFNADRPRRKVILEQGDVKKHPYLFRVLVSNGPEAGERYLLSANSIWPVGQEAPVLGSKYAAWGDWVLVDRAAGEWVPPTMQVSQAVKEDLARVKSLFKGYWKGIVVKENKHGATVILPSTKQGSKFVNVSSRYIIKVRKPGQKVSYRHRPWILQPMQEYPSRVTVTIRNPKTETQVIVSPKDISF